MLGQHCTGWSEAAVPTRMVLLPLSSTSRLLRLPRQFIAKIVIGVQGASEPSRYNPSYIIASRCEMLDEKKMLIDSMKKLIV